MNAYRVGVRTTANIPDGSSAHFCKIGAAKATVLPEPVLLPPMQSFPLRISGMQPFWIPVGRLMAMLARDRTSHGRRLRDSKLVFGSVGAKTCAGGLWSCSPGFSGTPGFPFSTGPRFMREGALKESMALAPPTGSESDSSPSSLSRTASGEVLRRFRGSLLSRESESESNPARDPALSDSASSDNVGSLTGSLCRAPSLGAVDDGIAKCLTGREWSARTRISRGELTSLRKLV